SMAQLTRSGYVYVISNKGSFGENMYKIGMTRRLEPMDRVKELGDASVPFFFDVHALIPSDDAPALENKLHSKFASRRVNKVNHRREFFNLTFEEVEEALNEFVEGDFNLVRDVVAAQYEESKFLEEREVVNG
ncbi:GIY-YIG nuclease family protein, partial [Vibrio navarrensis]